MRIPPIGTILTGPEINLGMIVDFGPDRVDVVAIWDGPGGATDLMAGNHVVTEIPAGGAVTLRGYFNPDED